MAATTVFFLIRRDTQEVLAMEEHASILIQAEWRDSDQLDTEIVAMGIDQRYSPSMAVMPENRALLLQMLSMYARKYPIE